MSGVPGAGVDAADASGALSGLHFVAASRVSGPRRLTDALDLPLTRVVWIVAVWFSPWPANIILVAFLFVFLLGSLAVPRRRLR